MHSTSRKHFINVEELGMHDEDINESVIESRYLGITRAENYWNRKNTIHNNKHLDSRCWFSCLSVLWPDDFYLNDEFFAQMCLSIENILYLCKCIVALTELYRECGPLCRTLRVKKNSYRRFWWGLHPNSRQLDWIHDLAGLGMRRMAYPSLVYVMQACLATARM